MLVIAATTKPHGAGLCKKSSYWRYRRNHVYSTAHHPFVKIPQRYDLHPFDLSLETFTSFGFAKNIQGKKSDHNSAQEGLVSFVRSNAFGTNFTKFDLCTALNSCAKTRNQHLGLQVHARIIQTGHLDNLYINSALVDVYAKCNALVDARKVFDGMKCHDQVSWTSIITGFSQSGCGEEAICLFKEMLGTQVKPNCFTYVSVISGCTELELAFEYGTLLHAHVTKLGHGSNNFVVSCLIDCYSKCGKIDQAVLLFKATRERDSILLNSMISGYARNLYGEEALNVFMEMRKDNISPTEHTLTSILDACGSLTVLQQGQQVHALVTKMGSDSNVFVVSALIDMYSKCGTIDEARHAFDQAVVKNSILCTSMITGYAQNGRGPDGLELFESLVVEEDFVPDHICFTAVLTACNHAGFLSRALVYFDKMRRDYSLVPQLDQYACLVDLYARSGLLKKAYELMKEMPSDPNSVMWSSFLSSCKLYGEVELGREAAYRLFKLEPHSAVPYITLANIYAGAGLWSELADTRSLMKQKGVRKSTGWSWVEVKKRVHVFSAGDESHSESKEIYVVLGNLNLDMKEAGYQTDKQSCIIDDQQSE
ncbi:hypothetical protein RJ640_030476 [Escallonia rubra]|uniref:Pentatricopeptide repeat-containing protein n=1 Tax=Escallonia rubra TaxID=112253 RepID=A0AA88U269_9ASTE|nr:hypothetical protein RJ640_030476 [Escallonia rubra]